MQQTIFSMLALLLVGSFTLGQHRRSIQTYNELVDDELEVAASGVAMHIMEIIGNRAFDARTLPETIKEAGLPTGTAGFTSFSAFGRAAGCDLDEPFRDSIPCADIDDADMADDDWQVVPFRLKDGKELPFEVNVQVFYVDPLNLDQPLDPGLISLHKKVVVKIRSERHVRQHRYTDGFVRIERIFSYDAKRAENRFKEEFPPTTETNTEPVEVITADTGGDNNGGDVYDMDEMVELDPDTPVTICHRSVWYGKITWSTRTVAQKYVAKHIGHGDYLGMCKN